MPALFLTRQLLSKQDYFLYTDKLNLVIFGLRHSDLQIRYFDVAGQVKKVGYAFICKGS